MSPAAGGITTASGERSMSLAASFMYIAWRLLDVAACRKALPFAVNLTTALPQPLPEARCRSPLWTGRAAWSSALYRTSDNEANAHQRDSTGRVARGPGGRA